MSAWGDTSRSREMRTEFDEDACTCDHPAAVHDDGFGCTEPGPEGAACPCIAGWVFALGGAGLWRA